MITSFGVNVNDKTPDAPLTAETAFGDNGGIVFGVVLNGVADDINTFAARVNGESATITVE